jgi:hypothetical protein
MDGVMGDVGHYGFNGFLPELTCIPTSDSLGLQLARLADLPEDVLTEAARVTTLLEEQHSVNKASSEAGRIAQRRRIFLRVIMTLYCLSGLPSWSLTLRCFLLPSGTVADTTHSGSGTLYAT